MGLGFLAIMVAERNVFQLGVLMVELLSCILSASNVSQHVTSTVTHALVFPFYRITHGPGYVLYHAAIAIDYLKVNFYFHFLF
jgi:hypothetical protein